ncbi:MAG: class I SAM-dependent methyltransferase [Solobacterium sp.]|nr:class I SAM-dependent methyltransferase [Solobacterium sp.]
MDKKAEAEKSAEMRTAELLKDAREHHVPVMMDSGMAFLLAFLKEHTEIRDILECGTAVGYSAIRMASVRWDMRVDTLEIDPDMFAQARANIEAQGLSDRIHVWQTDAAQFETDRIYDLIFVDAAKSQYRRYQEHFMKNTRPGTWFVFDNLNFHGIVDHPDLSSNRSTIQMTAKIRKFREHLLQDPRFETVFYPDIGDGIAIAQRIL